MYLASISRSAFLQCSKCTVGGGQRTWLRGSTTGAFKNLDKLIIYDEEDAYEVIFSLFFIYKFQLPIKIDFHESLTSLQVLMSAISRIIRVCSDLVHSRTRPLRNSVIRYENTNHACAILSH